MELKNYHEIVGTLVEVNEQDDVVKAVFEIKKTVEFPKVALPKDTLKEHLHRKIGIINIDGTYRIRKLRMPIDDFKEKECKNCKKSDLCSTDDKELFYCLIEKLNELKKSN